MMSVPLSEMSISQLVSDFTDNGIAQGQAWRIQDIEEYTRLYWLMDAIEKELKSRDGDARSALIPLYTHPAPHVRLKAAKLTLALEPIKARQVLQDIADSYYSERLDAGMCLANLDHGVFKPT
jgi:hypothetical protein